MACCVTVCSLAQILKKPVEDPTRSLGITHDLETRAIVWEINPMSRYCSLSWGDL
jgi:hypothetical protein